MQIRKMLAAFISFMMIYPVVSVSAFAVDETQIVTDLVSPAYEYAAKTENYLTITSSTADEAPDCPVSVPLAEYPIVRQEHIQACRVPGGVVVGGKGCGKHQPRR